MHAKVVAALVAALVGFGAIATSAAAHNLYVSPRADLPGATFYFRGTYWQPYQRVRWFYDRDFDRDVDQSGSFFASRSGAFRVTWRSASPGVHRMCFRQYDSRRRFQRTFFVCRRFEVFGTD